MPNHHHAPQAAPHRRFELGQPYRLIELQPGTIVVREANRSQRRIITGSPCCRRVVWLKLDDLEWRITQRIKGNEVIDYDTRQCPDCRAVYLLRLPSVDTFAKLEFAATVEWQVR